ncbi:UNVERIFIED_ORG: pentapeptide repeat protein [Actinomadura viridilutea]
MGMVAVRVGVRRGSRIWRVWQRVSWMWRRISRRWARVWRRGWSLAAWLWMAAAGAAAAAAIWFTTGWLLDTTGHEIDRDPGASGADRARVRVEAVRTGLAAGAGAGAAVGLMLAFRRQAHTEYDAAERRVTELYNAAAEQLASDKAPVRLTALYTLERLANDNPRHRQTIVNIICAYLRMPYIPPADQPADDRQRQAARRYRAARTGLVLVPEPPPSVPDPHEEREVRLTAQRILHTHLQSDADVPWTGITLDLTHATLIDFALNNCTVRSASFDGAIFEGTASFHGATFENSTSFHGATFKRPANFGGATFESPARFGGATFEHFASFKGATFERLAFFGSATFEKLVFFDEATFKRPANFGGATFGRLAFFDDATFEELAFFHGATFEDFASFKGTTFKSPASFDEAIFKSPPSFDGTRGIARD